MDVRLETGHVFLREDVRDDFSLACVFSAVACVEQAGFDRYKGRVEVRLQKSGAMAVDDRNRRWICDRQVVRRDSDVGACPEQIFNAAVGITKEEECQPWSVKPLGAQEVAMKTINRCEMKREPISLIIASDASGYRKAQTTSA